MVVMVGALLIVVLEAYFEFVYLFYESLDSAFVAYGYFAFEFFEFMFWRWGGLIGLCICMCGRECFVFVVCDEGEVVAGAVDDVFEGGDGLFAEVDGLPFGDGGGVGVEDEGVHLSVVIIISLGVVEVINGYMGGRLIRLGCCWRKLGFLDRFGQIFVYILTI